MSFFDCPVWQVPELWETLTRIIYFGIVLLLGIMVYIVYKRGNGTAGMGGRWMKWIATVFISIALLTLVLRILPYMCLLPTSGPLSFQEPYHYVVIFGLVVFYSIKGIVLLWPYVFGGGKK